MSVDAMRLERTLRLRQQNDRRKGRKGRKPPATIGRVGFVNDINRLGECCGGRFAPRGGAETGGNWRKPPKTLLEKLSAASLFHFQGPLRCKTTTALPEIPEIPEIPPARRRTGRACGRKGMRALGSALRAVDPAPLAMRF